jgi:hypothetical protein
MIHISIKDAELYLQSNKLNFDFLNIATNQDRIY